MTTFLLLRRHAVKSIIYVQKRLFFSKLRLFFLLIFFFPWKYEVLWNDSYFFEITGNLLKKKFAFTSKDLFKEDFLLNSKSFKEDIVSQTYLWDSCSNSKSVFQQIFSSNNSPLLQTGRHNNVPFKANINIMFEYSFPNSKFPSKEEILWKFDNCFFKRWDPFVKQFSWMTIIIPLKPPFKQDKKFLFEWHIFFHRSHPCF